MGHICRQSSASPLRFVHCWRDDSWWNGIKHNPSRPRRAVGGAIRVLSTSAFYELLGARWQALAAQRDAWRLVFPALGGRELDDAPSALRPIGFVSHISNKFVDLAEGCLPSRPCGVPLILVSDCAPLVQAVNGTAKINSPQVEEAAWFVYLLAHKFGLPPIVPGGRLVCHQQRRWNSLADCTANWLLDEGRDEFFWMAGGSIHIGSKCELQISSDGSFRRKEGVSRSACASLVQLHDSECGLTQIVAIWAQCCTASDSFEAETAGLLLSCRLCARVLRCSDAWCG
jgi:hypothetical protein